MTAAGRGMPASGLNQQLHVTLRTLSDGFGCYKSLDPGRWLGIPMKTVTTDENYVKEMSRSTPRRPCNFFIKVFEYNFAPEKDRGRSESP